MPRATARRALLHVPRGANTCVWCCATTCALRGATTCLVLGRPPGELSIDEVTSHKLLENKGRAKTYQEMRDVIKEIDQDSDGYVVTLFMIYL